MSENEKTTRRVPHVVEAVASVPWAITEEALATIVAIAQRENDVTTEALEAYRGKRVAGADALEIREGVGIIRVAGPMFRYADFFTAISGGATYEGIAKDLNMAAADPNIRSMLMFWDTPGGEVNGCAELAAMIHSIGAKKPIESYVGGSCCSAGYWLASATSRITIGSTAMLGSIGVRLGVRDSRERDAKSGVKTIEFISSNAPNKRMDLDSDAGRAKIQRTADQLEAVFLADVAKYRGVSVEEVIAKFGQGGVEIGQEAITAGLADRIGSFEETIASLSAGSGKLIANQNRRTVAMTEKTFTQAEVDELTAKAKTDASAEASARITAIMDSEEGKAHPSQARHLAFSTQLSAKDAIGIMAAAPPEVKPATTPAPDANANASKPAPAANDQEGRSQSAAGGLALDTQLENGKKPDPEKPAAINVGGIYANRAKAMGAR